MKFEQNPKRCYIERGDFQMTYCAIRPGAV